MPKVYNFGAGPGMLPEEVLQVAQNELLNWRDTGVSVMELGHRGEEFQALTVEIEADLRRIMQIPENYTVLFLPGGATAQFSMVPMNLMGKNQSADYIDTGLWSKKAIAEAQRFGDVNIAATTTYHDNLACVPPQDEWKLRADAAYLHYTPNETIVGLEFNQIPNTGDVPLVADMTSMILSRPVDVKQYGLIYAGAQKNVGQAGVTIVIVRNDLMGHCVANTPSPYQYHLQAEAGSVYNTPPTYSWYMTGLVLKWIDAQGGVEAIYQKNLAKAALLYQAIDESEGFYQNWVKPEYRSIMNVAFFLKDNQQMELFLEQASHAGLKYLKGHRSAGGIRASIYNAMPIEGVRALVDFMNEFAKKNR